MSTTLTTAMIFAAGRGERMRPLTDTRPKPLLEAGGKPLIVWQIEALARAGIETIVINHAWLGEQLEATLGDGSRWGVRLAYSAEGDALETAGGIAKALPLLERDGQPTVFAAVAGDVYCAFDYRTLAARAAEMAALEAPAMHLVMVPNPPFHPAGDFVLRDDGRLALAGAPRVTFGSIGVYDTRMFRDIAPGTHRALKPYFQATIEAGRATGELYEGIWENVGTPAQLGELDARLRAAAS
jgi:MurNAc alpha-1-phosphate uridylyltransferase